MSEYIKPERSDGLIFSSAMTFEEIQNLLLPIYEDKEDLHRVTSLVMVDPMHIVVDTNINICIVYNFEEKLFRIITTKHDRNTIKHFYGVKLA